MTGLAPHDPDLARQRLSRSEVVHASRLVDTQAPTYPQRLDPLHEVFYNSLQSTSFRDVGLVRHHLSIEHGSVVHARSMEYCPVAVSPARAYRPVSVQMVALLAQFHQLTTYQVASWIGVPSSTVWAAASALHAAGIIQRAIPPWWRRDEDLASGGSGSLWQLNFNEIEGDSRTTAERGKAARKETALQSWLDGLTDVEHLLVTGGRDIGQGTQGSRSTSSIRHNLVLAELALRAVECCPAILGAWGEPFGTASAFTDDRDIRSNIADAVLVTRTGGLVVIETSGKANLDNGNAGQVLGNKAAAWAAIAARSPVDMKVLFVDISNSKRKRRSRFGYHVMEGVKRSSQYLTRTRDQEKARSCVGVVSAFDWFPLPGVVTEGFLALESYDPFDRTYRPTIESATPSDPTRVQALHTTVSRTDPVVNTLAALHTPAWTVRSPAPTVGS